MNSNTKIALSNLGLSEPEINIYLALMKLGGSIASKVAKETGYKRTSTYSLLSTLAKKGFVLVYFRNNTRYYYAQKPANVANVFEKRLNDFINLIPSIASIEKAQTQTVGLRLIETKDELKSFYLNVLKRYKGKSYSIIGNLHGWEDLDYDFFTKFRRDRGLNKTKTRLLLTADSKPSNPEDPELRREVRFLPEKYLFKSTIDIYDDEVLIVSPEISALAVVISIPAMTDIFKSVFEIMWDSTEK